MCEYCTLIGACKDKSTAEKVVMLYIERAQQDRVRVSFDSLFIGLNQKILNGNTMFFSF